MRRRRCQRGRRVNQGFSVGPDSVTAMSADAPSRLATALLDSRARWRDLALLGSTLLFETDAAGHFTFLAPDDALGHAAASLLGTPARALVAAGGADPFGEPAHGLRARLRGQDGVRWLEFSTVALPGGGLRGVARDVTAAERQAEAAARTLRRSSALGRLLGLALRQDTATGPDALLDGLHAALGCGGIAVLECRDGAWHSSDPAAAAVLAGMAQADQAVAGVALMRGAPDCALLAWRDTPFDEDESAILTALAAPVAALHDSAARRRALDQAARTDPLTGLLNRRGFAEALGARLAAGASGTLAYIDLDGLKPLNDVFGHAAGDAALRAMATRLRSATRPGDAVARLGGDEFAWWVEAPDEAAVAARCAAPTAPGPLAGWPQAGPAALRASLGLATARRDDSVESLLARADAAMYAVKRPRRAA